MATKRGALTVLYKEAKLTKQEASDAGDTLRMASAGQFVPYLGLGSAIYGTMKLRSTARQHYGDDWRQKYRDKPGSFTARHPILGNLLPFVSPVSGFRGATHFEREAAKVGKKKKKKKKAIKKVKKSRQERRKENRG
jgi:hypothetical protein